MMCLDCGKMEREVTLRNGGKLGSEGGIGSLPE